MSDDSSSPYKYGYPQTDNRSGISSDYNHFENNQTNNEKIKSFNMRSNRRTQMVSEDESKYVFQKVVRKNILLINIINNYNNNKICKNLFLYYKFYKIATNRNRRF